MENRNIVCRWCGYEGEESEFDLDPTQDGFWCPDCDGYTFRDESKNAKPQIVLLLESAGIEQNKSQEAQISLNKRLSPLRYPGGKAMLAEQIAEHLEPDHLETFVECFAGGAAVGLALLDAGYVRHLVLNDTDPGVYAFWKEVTERPESLIWHLEQPVFRADYAAAKEVLETPSKFSCSEVAWSELLCSRLSFSGITKGSGIQGGRHGSDAQLFARYNPKTLIRRIEHIHSMADAIEVTSTDACNFIGDYAFWDDKTTLFVDPPYVRVGKRLYRKYYEDDDHKELAWTLQSLCRGFPCANIIITYDDCELIRDLYPDATFLPVSRRYTLQHALRCG